MTTLDVLAAEVGVSPATVSRALRGKNGVSDAVRQRVLAAAEAAGYVASRRSTGIDTDVVGLVVPELDNPVFPAFVQRMQTLLVQQGYTPIVGSQFTPGVSEDEWIELMLGRQMAGLVVVNGMHADTKSSPDRYLRLRRLGVPLVLVNGFVPDLDATFLAVDDASAVEMAVQHLVTLGHRTIGLAVGPERYTPVVRKVEAMQRLVEDRRGRDGEVTGLVEHSLFTIEGGQATGRRLIEAGATGIVCASDPMALGVIRAARAMGLSIPDDVSVIGFDDSPVNAFMDPPLTSLRQPVSDMASVAITALVEQLRTGQHPTTEYLFAPELIVRGTTGPAPSR
ncbi:LacI family DNA-binding transcriptional regulator [Aquipuribacter sp. SD81]|uniref:LacI family DNA-binding transcriptional regulator n=1 Tax=Aquipuribacter sp. SD81 TaxID=3127703 RepID=UPI003019F52F